MDYLYLDYRIWLQGQKDPLMLIGGQDSYTIVVSLLFMFFMLIHLLVLN